jgi:hypothetical protein
MIDIASQASLGDVEFRQFKITDELRHRAASQSSGQRLTHTLVPLLCPQRYRRAASPKR